MWRELIYLIALVMLTGGGYGLAKVEQTKDAQVYQFTSIALASAVVIIVLYYFGGVLC